MYRYDPVTVDRESLARAADLLGTTFSNRTLYTPEYLTWQYAANPAGTAQGFNAIDHERGTLAAHYVCQPFDALIDGTPRRGLLSLNTATHPEHQGRRLFTELAERTYDAAASAGFDFVIGVANAQSTHGFTKRLGFQLVAPLLALIGVGQLHFVDGDPSRGYRRRWTEDSIAWRLRNPNTAYEVRHGNIWAKTTIPMLDVLIGRTTPGVQQGRPAISAPLHLWIGCDGFLDRARSRLYANLPQRLRPSPLNLIYKDLRDASARLDPREVHFWAMDFDAY